MVVTLLIFALITIGCVSAADDVQTDDAVAVDDDTIVEEILTDGNNEVGSYTELKNYYDENAVEGSTLVLTKDYKYNSSTDSSLYQGVQMKANNLVVDGQGHTLDGNKQAGIIRPEGYTMTFKNIIFKNANNNVGALLSYYNLIVINCTFIGNAGGYSVHPWGSGQIINCTFENNTHTPVSCGGLVENCKFINNRDSYSTGALHMYYGTVRNCTFIGNRAPEYGAVYTNYPITIEDCTFINNRATGSAYYQDGCGAIHVAYDSDEIMYVLNCTFINNTSPFNQEAFVIDNNWVILNCSFENSAVVIDKDFSYHNMADAVIENSVFKDTIILNKVGNITLSKNTFENAYISNINGTFLSPVYVVVPEYSQENDNSLILLRVVDDNGNSIYDGRIFDDFISLTIGDEVIPLDDFVQIDGNWYYTTSKELPEGTYEINVNINNPDEFYRTYSQNSVSNGTLEVGDYSSFADLENALNSGESIITLTEDYIFNLTGGFDKNGIVINKDNIVIDGNGHKISGVTVARIFNITGQNVTLKNINFVSGFGDKGGAVYSLSDVTIENCTFTNNIARDGGAVYIGNGKIIDSTFTNNIASEHGGAAYLINANITNSTFTQNRAAENGGAVYIKNKGDIKDSKFDKNSAEAGGAAYINGESNIINAKFTQNTADKGGALYLLGNGNIDRSTFTSNDAERGLGIMNAALLKIANTKFADGNSKEEIVLFLDGSVILNNVTPKDLFPIFAVDLYVGGNVSYLTDYGREVTTVDIDIMGEMRYLYRIVFDITAKNEETLLNHGTITMRIGNADFTGQVIDGHAIIPVPVLDVGNYTITFTYNGGDQYQKPIAQKTIVINKEYATIHPDYNTNEVAVGEIYTASITLWNDGSAVLVGGELIFNIDNMVNVTATTNNDGVAVLSITPSLVKIIGYGQKYVRIIFNGNKNLYETSATNYLTIVDGGVNPPSGTAGINSNGEYSTLITDDLGRPLQAGETVVLSVGNTTVGIAVTDANGIVTFNIPEDVLKELQSGNATITLSYTSDGYPHVIDKNVTIKPDPQIVAKAASYVINYGGKYSVTMKDANGQVLAGKQVTFILNGKTIGSAVTNANGVATFKLTASMLKTAKAGSKNLVIKFNGDASYSIASKTVKLTIKKEKTKFAAKKKTFKRATKTKKYTITLKNSKGKAVKKVRVYLKVGKKTYKAKTNSKGKATFKITKLTKTGKYTAKLTFKANAYYLKATKKVKITVK